MFISTRKGNLLLCVMLLTLAVISCGAPSASSPLEVEGTFTALAFPQPVAATQAPEPTQIPIPAAIPESRLLILEYPPRMRAAAEGDVVRLTLEVDDLGNITPTAKVEGNLITGEKIEIPDLYETHDVTAEARLDLAGVIVQPSDSTFEPLKPGQSVTFYWSIHPQAVGVYRGTVWLHLNFVERISGEKSRIAVSAQVVEIKAVDFFGMSVNVARTSGVVGSVLGGVLGFPFIEEILRFLFRKRKK